MGDGPHHDAVAAPPLGPRAGVRHRARRPPSRAVVDALAHLGVTHIDIPITPEKVWRILKDKGVAE